MTKPLYEAIRHKVSNEALKELVREHRKVERNPKLMTKPAGELPACRCTISLALGLPCQHLIFHRIQSKQLIQLSDIHPHWYIRTVTRRAQINAPFEPAQAKTKGRPRGSDNLAKSITSRSTRRLPSYFEVIEARERQEALSTPRLQPPPSTAPAAMTSTSLKRGLEFLEEEGDSYEPGTEPQRAAQRARCRTPSTLSAASSDYGLIEEVDEDNNDAEGETCTKPQYHRNLEAVGWDDLEVQLEEELATLDCIEVATSPLE
jgi:hypothetical protein